MKGVASLEKVAARVVRRVAMAHWVRLLAQSAVAVFPVAAVAALAAWFVWGTPIGAGWAAGVMMAWAGLSALWGLWHRPSPVAALALWDERAGRHEMFVSAYCFERLPAAGPGERLHLDHARSRLSDDLARLRHDLPLRLPRWVWLLSVLFLAVATLLPEAGTAELDEGIDDNARASAVEVADALEEEARRLPGAENLSEKEKEDLRKLQSALDQTADKLRKLEGRTPRDVLTELERRAHEAQALADDLDAAADLDLSSEMLAELERHADTTDLAAALRAKDLERASAEAERLAERLEHKELTLEERNRIERALEKALGKASKRDKEGLVGKHLQKAHEGLRKKRPEEAASRFRQLAKRLKQSRLRQLARRRLEQMANQLRSSGQRIFGRTPSSIRRLNPNRLAGLHAVGGQSPRNAGSVPLQIGQKQLGRVRPGMPIALAPGSPKGSPTGRMIFGPFPGKPQGFFPVPGTCPGGNPGGAPIPGSCPGGVGACPVPGTAGGAMTGGLEAGRGTAPYGDTATRPLAPTSTGTVNAPPRGAGPSAVRAVDGGSHREEPGRDFQQVAMAAIQAEEEALADEPLPLCRRQQVLRYFTAIRRQLVDSEPKE